MDLLQQPQQQQLMLLMQYSFKVIVHLPAST